MKRLQTTDTKRANEMTDEAWIEQSLARLETLETHKAQLEEAGQPVPAEVEEEIVTLYEALEAEAGDEANTAAAPATPAPAQPAVAAAPAVQRAPDPMLSDDPFAPQPSAGRPAPAPFSAAPAPVSMGPDPSAYDYDDDISPKGGKGGLMALAAVLIVGVGIGGWWYTTQTKKPDAPPPPVGDPQVISASSVPEDTQEPQAAKGADVERTAGSRYKEGPAPARSGGSKRKGARNRPRNNNKGKGDDDRKVELSKSDDPLSGI